MAPKSTTKNSASHLAVKSKKVAVADSGVVSALGIVAPPPILVSCDAFEGSLGMLFACVKERRIDLLDIPIAPICEAYYFYLLESSETQLDEAGAAIVALSYLLERKAWRLLPTSEPEPEEVEDSIDLLTLLPGNDKFLEAIQCLSLWKQERDQMFFRSHCLEALQPSNVPLENVCLGDLARAFDSALNRSIEVPEMPTMAVRMSLGQVMKELFLQLSFRWQTFDELVPTNCTRLDCVYWFLAILELIRMGQATLRQVESRIEFSRAKPQI